MGISLLVRIGQTFLRWRTRRLAIRQLMELDGRLLSDIGIDHGQIESAVDGLARASDAARLSAQSDGNVSRGPARPDAVPARICEA